MLLVGREEVNDPVDRLGRVDGVERREDEVPGLSGGQRRGHGLHVPHLTDENDVRVLSHGGPQGRQVVAGVDAHLALVDHGHVVLVQDLDGVLDRQDVAGTVVVDVVDHGREGGRLPRPGRAGHQYQPALGDGQLRHHWGQSQLLE